MSLSPALVAGALALLVLATWAHYAFWTWRLGVPTHEDEVVRARTRDGWTLALGRRRPRGAARGPPVLLVHGIAVNRQSLDFGVERYSLSRYLAQHGFDCFALDLRGHGGSRRGRGPGAPRRWNLDTYLREDVPAALDAIERETGAREVLWVGHSQGAILGLAAATLYPDRIRALVALAAPAHFDVQERLRKLVKLRFLMAWRTTRLGARMLAPFSGYWHPAVAELAIHMRNVERPIYRRILANAIEDLQPGVLDQFATFIREDSFRSMDGAVDYRAGLSLARQPALFVAAEKDGIAPPAAVESAFRSWGGPKVFDNLGHEYGHSDLLLGRNAPDFVFPRIREFLEAHSAGEGLRASGP